MHNNGKRSRIEDVAHSAQEIGGHLATSKLREVHQEFDAGSTLISLIRLEFSTCVAWLFRNYCKIQDWAPNYSTRTGQSSLKDTREKWILGTRSSDRSL
jgi:hypothetical protein